MKILKATVDKRPRTCAGCPICAEQRKGYECGRVEPVHKGYGVQYEKIPNKRCLLAKE